MSRCILRHIHWRGCHLWNGRRRRRRWNRIKYVVDGLPCFKVGIVRPQVFVIIILFIFLIIF